jgi:hypothetical protein
MALVRCGECNREVSDKAATCPNCGAPVDATTAIAAPDRLAVENGNLVGTSAMIAELAKKAIGRLNYRIDATDIAAGTATFTTGMTMGSWTGVSGTVSWEETAPYRFRLSGQGKQNVKGGQVVALNLFDEANGKVENVINEMKRLAAGGSESEAPTGGCMVIAAAMCGLPLLYAVASHVA